WYIGETAIDDTDTIEIREDSVAKAYWDELPSFDSDDDGDDFEIIDDVNDGSEAGGSGSSGSGANDSSSAGNDGTNGTVNSGISGNNSDENDDANNNNSNITSSEAEEDADDELSEDTDQPDIKSNKESENNGQAKISSVSKIKNIKDLTPDEVVEEDLFYARFVDTIDSPCNYTINKVRVSNGTLWGSYLVNVPTPCRQCSSYSLSFAGWEYNGKILSDNDIVKLSEDATIYAKYNKIGTANKYKLNFPEYNKTVTVEDGDMLSDYDIPTPKRKGDSFIGWIKSESYPISDPEQITFANDVRFSKNMTTGSTTSYYAAWENTLKNHYITTTDSLTMKEIYYVNEEVLPEFGCCEGPYIITKYSNKDLENANKIYQKILSKKGENKYLVILPKNYEFKTKKHNNCSYIYTNLETDEFIRAVNMLFLTNFNVLNYLTTSFDTDLNELLDDAVWGVGTNKTIDGIECLYEVFKSFDEESLYCGIRTNKFIKLSNKCKKVDQKVEEWVNKLGFDTNTTITDAIIKLNDYLHDNMAYDFYFLIRDVLFTSVETRQEAYQIHDNKKYHGICSGYSMLTSAIFAKCGYYAPCAYNGTLAKGEGDHAFNQVVINGKKLYIDYTYNSPRDESRDMLFLDEESMNNSSNHKAPFVMDEMDKYAVVNETISDSTKPSKAVIKKISNPKSGKIIIKLKKDSNINGYQVEYSTNKNFSKSKTIYSKKSSIAIKNLVRNDYYIRVRACYNSSYTKTFKTYGSWSSKAKKTVK
nr:hypothetical protein [Lachnospiraceae bacterium]